MNTLPLLPESGMNSIVAYRGATPVSRARFLRDVHTIAAHIPETGHVLNLCKDRYWFAATLFACISRDILTVLPSSAAPEIIADLGRTHPELICISDQAAAPHPLPYLQAGDHLTPHTGIPAVPDIPADRKIMCVYTSGSTGKPRGHVKTFGRLYQCARAEAGHMWQIAGGPCAVLGTVPFQHMYGLESTIFLPLLGGGQLTSRQPFFPADVHSALAELPEPRLLVTTPFHLRKLVDADMAFPAIATNVSATAPLSPELAAEAEARLAAPIVEIYGSTETGQIATRQPVRSSQWRLYDDIRLTQEGSVTTASGGHLEGPQVLNDVLELHGAERFSLLGRNSDMVNIVGKRSSLAYLNQIIANLPGVIDAVFCIPQTGAENEISRLAAFVVAPGLQSHDIQSSLLQKLDPVFLPRPIVFVEALPRDGNGKLTASAMTELLSRHLS